MRVLQTAIEYPFVASQTSSGSLPYETKCTDYTVHPYSAKGIQVNEKSFDLKEGI